MKHRVIFLGTPKIAARCLQALLDTDVEVVGVITKPDKPVGRKQDIVLNPVKILALKHHLPVFQPIKMNEIYEKISSLKPDLMLSCAYGQLIPESVLQIPKFHCVNIHTSLLPRWRGGAPIHWAILKRDVESGVTMMFMVKELDAGDIIYQTKVKIEASETYRSLYDKLESISYQMIVEKIHNLFNENVPRIKQDVKQVTIAKNISRDDEKIHWDTNAVDIEAKVRGLFDQPIAYTMYENLNVKIIEAHTVASENDVNHCGEIIDINKEGIFVNTAKGTLIITKLQLPSRKPTVVKDMLNGNHPFKINSIFS